MIPSPSLTVPSLAYLQMSYGGLSFGGIAQGSTYQLQEYPEGLDTPDYASGDVQRAIEQGEYAGVDLSPGRTVVIKQVVRAESAAKLDEARQQLAGVLTPQGAVESPLYVQLASGLFACMARPRKHRAPLGLTSVLGERQRQVGTEASTMFHATDPRWYSTPTQTATVGLPEPSGGLVPPVTPPVLIEGGAFGGLIECVNAGPMYSYPVFVITGPCKNPRITNLSLPGAPSIAFEISLNSGDRLTIGMDWQSVVLVSSGSTVGSSRRDTEKAGNTWFSFPGDSTNIIEFTSEDSSHVAGTLTVNWCSAYMGI